ncbi:Protein RETICULATA-RELATED 4, chloroplastic [Linum perenne]
MASSHPISTVKSPATATVRYANPPIPANSSTPRPPSQPPPPEAPNRGLSASIARQRGLSLARMLSRLRLRWLKLRSTLTAGRLRLRNGTKLFAVGTASSLIGTSAINALIIAKKAVGKSGEVENVPILSTSVGYGVYMIVSSNLRTAVFGEYICRGRVANTSKRVS